ncbi:MAG: Hpt domain-containing protein [Rhodoferax sp.]|nr:Hpt domain-containing protein [Rhodoferax sp.]MDP3652759.1 Hpt domain-containing protein [Rhodoferax sp.]
MPTAYSDSQEPIYLDPARALEQIGDSTALHEMLDMLQAALDRDIPQISQFLAAHNVSAANRLLHSLKGFIPIFCVDALCDHVAQVEMLSKSGSAADVAHAYAQLSPKLVQLQAEIDVHLG